MDMVTGSLTVSVWSLKPTWYRLQHRLQLLSSSFRHFQSTDCRFNLFPTTAQHLPAMQFNDSVLLMVSSMPRSSPYHPVSNGLAERAVQTVKNALKKSVGGSDLESRLYRFLFQYRLTPQSTTGQCPFQLMMGPKPRSRLDLTFWTCLRRFSADSKQP